MQRAEYSLNSKVIVCSLSVNSDLGSPCCKLQGYCNRVARVGGCKRCRRRGDKGAFTSSAGDPRVPLYLPSVGINCLSLDNGATPRIPGRGARLCVSLRRKFENFSSLRNKIEWLFSLIEEENISSGSNGEYSCVGLGRGDDNNERKFIGTLHVDNFYSYIVLSAALFLVLRSIFIKRSYEYIHGWRPHRLFPGPDIAG